MSDKTKIHIRDAAFAVDCPLCFAVPGGACVSEDGADVVPIHDSRVNDFKEIVARAKDEERVG